MRYAEPVVTTGAATAAPGAASSAQTASKAAAHRVPLIVPPVVLRSLDLPREVRATPRPARAGVCHHAGVRHAAPVHVAYRIPGWGIGELVLVDGRPVYSGSPRKRLSEPERVVEGADCEPDADDAAESLVGSIARFFAGEPV